MKLARTLVDGSPAFILSNGDGRWVAASDAVGEDLDYAALVGRLQDGIATDALQSAPEVTPSEFLPPTGPLDKSIAIGKNYVAHVEETGSEIPTHPVVFSKLPNSFAGATADIVVDSEVTSKVDYEVELVVVIGKEAKNVSKEEAHTVIAGYTVGNDVSARDCQRRDGQFDYAKGMDTYGPIGPWITSADAVQNPGELRISSSVNGETRQNADTSLMIFPVDVLIEHLSRVITLKPGDLIWTGTPAGVALGLGESAFLKDGDVVTCEVEGLGELKNTVVVR
jgi:2-keto-4-pentenoate hydratase/2-oxohepta-3-ene-1,7-dioic acid hydratase in catechol pathway